MNTISTQMNHQKLPSAAVMSRMTAPATSVRNHARSVHGRRTCLLRVTARGALSAHRHLYKPTASFMTRVEYAIRHAAVLCTCEGPRARVDGYGANDAQ